MGLAQLVGRDADLIRPQLHPIQLRRVFEDGLEPPLLHIAADTLDTSPEDWRRVIDVDLTGTFFSMQAVLPFMVAQGSGSIVTTASVAAVVALPSMASYTAAKAGVVAVAKQVAFEFAKDGVRVNSICPGTVRTQMTEGTYTWAAGGDPEAGSALLETRAETIALQRLGVPQDVAAMAVFLLSDEAAYITGGFYPVDGGAGAANPFRPLPAEGSRGG